MIEYHNNILCVHGGWLYEEASLMTFNNYKKLCSRGRMNLVQRGGNGRVALVEYDSLPERFRKAYEEKYGNPHQLVAQNYFVSCIKHDNEAQTFFSEYKRANGLYLPADTQKEYYTNSIILNTIKYILTDRKEFRKARGNSFSITKFWLKTASDIDKIDKARYPHSLPTNDRRLKDRYMLYVNEGYESLIHRNFSNKNAAKVDDDVKESVLTELLADPRNMDNEQIARIYNIMAEKMNWKKITGSAVSVWREKLELYTYAGRRGETTFRNTKAMQTKRSKPTLPLLYWTLDGWDAELLYQKQTINAKGNKVTTYHNRLTMVVVLDPCVNYPVGYAIGTHETPELIAEAMRNATNHVAELFGQRYRVNQLQSDHYGKGNLTPMYEAMCRVYTPARVKNAKAKVIEPWFNGFNHKYCQLMPNWSGHGVTASKDNQPNSDYLDKYKKNFPDADGCRMQLELSIRREREEKIARYRELWGKVIDEHKIVLSDETYLYWFGAETGHKNVLQPDGLHVTIDGIRRTYDCFDRKFREYAYVRWTVKFDPADLTQALAVNDDGTLRFMLESKYIQPMALADRTDGDSEQLANVNEFNRKLEAEITERRSKARDTTTGLFDEHPELNDTLAKLILTDSRGQHKDERNAARAAAEKPKQITVQVVEDEDYEVVFDKEDFIRNNY